MSADKWAALEANLAERYRVCQDHAATPSSILLAVLNAVADANKGQTFIGADFSTEPSRLDVSFAAPVGDPIAYLHHVVHADGEPDQVLSFSPDDFPFDKIVTGTSVEPLFNAAQMAAAIEHAATCALRSPVQAASEGGVSDEMVERAAVAFGHGRVGPFKAKIRRALTAALSAAPAGRES